jgi:serine/threonine protein kinase
MLHKRTKYRRNNAKNTHKLMNRRKYTKKYRRGGTLLEDAKNMVASMFGRQSKDQVTNSNNSRRGSQFFEDNPMHYKIPRKTDKAERPMNPTENKSEGGVEMGEIYPADSIPESSGVEKRNYYTPNPMNTNTYTNFVEIVLSPGSDKTKLNGLVVKLEKFIPSEIIKGGRSGAKLIKLIKSSEYVSQYLPHEIILKIYTPRELPYNEEGLNKDLKAHEENPFNVPFLRGLTDIFNNALMSNDDTAREFLPKIYGFGLMNSDNIEKINPGLRNFLQYHRENLSSNSKMYYPYLIMENLSGLPLYETIGKNKKSILNPDITLLWYRIVWMFILYRIAFIMNYLRKNFGFCHRDLHPNNIYIDFDTQLKRFFNTEAKIYTEDFVDLLDIKGTITPAIFCEKMNELIFVKIIDFDLSKMNFDLSKTPIPQDVQKLVSNSNGCTRLFYTDIKSKARSTFSGQLISATSEFRRDVLGISQSYDRLHKEMKSDADLYAWGQLYTAFLSLTSPYSDKERVKRIDSLENFEACLLNITDDIDKIILPPLHKAAAAKAAAARPEEEKNEAQVPVNDNVLQKIKNAEAAAVKAEAAAVKAEAAAAIVRLIETSTANIDGVPPTLPTSSTSSTSLTNNKDNAPNLFLAAENGLKDIVQLLIDQGANIEHANDDGETALFRAAYNGHIDVVQLLIDQGANIEHADNGGYTALLRAVMKGHKDVVQLLIDARANIEHVGNYGRTALLWAAWKGYKDVVKLLIDQGANIEHADIYDMTALLCAACNGHKDVVQLLIDQGADVNHEGQLGTALTYAKMNRHKEVMHLLMGATRGGGRMKTRKQYKKMYKKSGNNRRNKTMRQKKYRYSITPKPRKGKRKQ